VESALVLLTAPREGTASASGGVVRERAPLGGIDFMLAETQRTEVQLDKMQRRLAVLDEEWRGAMRAEAQALYAEEEAREAVEERGPDTGEDVQEAMLAALARSVEAGKLVEALAKKKRAVEGVIERVKEENRRVGEDTRAEQAKRKRREAKNTDERRQAEERKEGDEEPTA
jgi:hypothetical protein